MEREGGVIEIFFLANYIIWPRASLSGRISPLLRHTNMYKQHCNSELLILIYYYLVDA